MIDHVSLGALKPKPIKEWNETFIILNLKNNPFNSSFVVIVDLYEN